MDTDTLPKLLLAAAHRWGNRVALREKEFGVWLEITWHEYARHAECVALALRELGLEPGDRVAILAENCREWLYADLAIQAIGGVTVGIPPTNPVPDVRYILEHSQARYVICGDQEQVDKVLEIEPDLSWLSKIIVIDPRGLIRYSHPLLMDFAVLEARGAEIASAEPDLFRQLVSMTRGDALAMILYTSGTTGAPKGSMVSHRNAIAMIEQMQTGNPIDETFSNVLYFPLCHIGGKLLSEFMPLMVGCTINISEGMDTVQAALYETQPTFFLGVPRVYEMFVAQVTIRMSKASWYKQWLYHRCLGIGRRYAEAEIANRGIPIWLSILRFFAYLMIFRPILDKLGLRRVRLAYCGGAATSDELLLFFRSLGLVIKGNYGQSESGTTVCHQGTEFKPGTVGKPLKGVEIQFAPDGEILIKSDSVFLGYWSNPEVTQQTLIDGWLHTGDIGHLDDEGYLVVVDRKKDVITRGERLLSPSAIENRLKFSPYINEAVAIGEGRPYVVALIQIEYETVADWAQRHRVAFTTFRSLAQHAEVSKLIAEEVRQANVDLAKAGMETVRAFALFEKELDEDDNELTSTRKVKRRTISVKFADMIENLYSGEPASPEFAGRTG